MARNRCQAWSSGASKAAVNCCQSSSDKVTARACAMRAAATSMRLATQKLAKELPAMVAACSNRSCCSSVKRKSIRAVLVLTLPKCTVIRRHCGIEMATLSARPSVRWDTFPGSQVLSRRPGREPPSRAGPPGHGVRPGANERSLGRACLRPATRRSRLCATRR